MTLTQSDLSDLLAALKAGEMTDTIRRSLEWILQELIEAEATTVVGARPHERSDTHFPTQRNGHRPRLLATAAGDVELKIPKLRQGSFFPSLLERRRRIDRALFAVVAGAYIHGVSTPRKVDDLVGALKGDLGHLQGRGEPGSSRRARRGPRGLPQPAAGPHRVPLRLRRRHLHQAGSRAGVVSRAVVVATGVSTNGDREVLGVAVGDSESGAFGPRSSRACGLGAFPGCNW